MNQYAPTERTPADGDATIAFDKSTTAHQIRKFESIQCTVQTAAHFASGMHVRQRHSSQMLMFRKIRKHVSNMSEWQTNRGDSSSYNQDIIEKVSLGRLARRGGARECLTWHPRGAACETICSGRRMRVRSSQCCNCIAHPGLTLA